MKALSPAISTTLTSKQWGDLAALALHANWRGHIRHVTANHILLVGVEGGVIRLVKEEIECGPLTVLVNQQQATAWSTLPLGLYVWRNGHTLRLGDDLTVRLPDSWPSDSTLSWWRADYPLTNVILGRRLALLSDWLMARAPEDTIAGVLPDLLAAGNTAEQAHQRADLPREVRLFRWRVGRIVNLLWPALASGDMAMAERAVKWLVVLDQSQDADTFMLGCIAGTQLWSEFLSKSSGLQAKSVLRRITRTLAEETNPLGQALLFNALDNHWDQAWHELYLALAAETTATGRSDVQSLRFLLFATANKWITQDRDTAYAALAGVVLPFLWYQRFIM